PFENPLPVFYLNGEALGWFGLFLPSLALKQFFVHQTFPPEVMKMKALTISVEETHIILPSPCEDHIRVTVNGVQKALQLSCDPIRIARPVRIEFSVFAGCLQNDPPVKVTFLQRYRIPCPNRHLVHQPDKRCFF